MTSALVWWDVYVPPPADGVCNETPNRCTYSLARGKEHIGNTYRKNYVSPLCENKYSLTLPGSSFSQGCNI